MSVPHVARERFFRKLISVTRLRKQYFSEHATGLSPSSIGTMHVQSTDLQAIHMQKGNKRQSRNSDRFVPSFLSVASRFVKLSASSSICPSIKVSVSVV